MQAQAQEMQTLMMMLYSQRLSPFTRDLYSLMLQEHGCLQQYSARVLGGGGSSADDESEEGQEESFGASSSAKVQLRLGEGELALDGGLLAPLQYLHPLVPQVLPRFLPPAGSLAVHATMCFV